MFSVSRSIASQGAYLVERADFPSPALSITCGNCVDLCPTDALRLEPAYRSPEADRPGKEFHEIPAPPPKPEAGGETAEA